MSCVDYKPTRINGCRNKLGLHASEHSQIIPTDTGSPSGQTFTRPVSQQMIDERHAGSWTSGAMLGPSDTMSSVAQDRMSESGGCAALGRNHGAAKDRKRRAQRGRVAKTTGVRTRFNRCNTIGVQPRVRSVQWRHEISKR
jgi:hypothetical protein